MKHRFSGWPGAWCLDCGQEDKNEIALLDPDFDFDNIQDLNDDCLEPGSNKHNPYFKKDDV